MVLKWFADETVADRYAVLLPALDALRSRGVPVPAYGHVLVVDGWTVSAQQVLSGASVRNPSPARCRETGQAPVGRAAVSDSTERLSSEGGGG